MSTDNDEINTPEDTDRDLALRSAGSQLRATMNPLNSDAIEMAALRTSERRARRRSLLASVACVVALIAAGVAWATRGTSAAATERATRTSAPVVARPRSRDALTKAQLLVSTLDSAPIDPTTERLTAKIRSYAGCPELLSSLQKVGAEHVGSGGFGSEYELRMPIAKTDGPAEGAAVAAEITESNGETIGTNVQVEGVDELDEVKAVGKMVYRLLDDRLFIVDTTSESVVGYLPLDIGDNDRRSASLDSLLISGTKLLVIGSESVRSTPIKGDPSARTATHEFVTLTTVDVADPSRPTVTERVRIAGYLVSARLVNDQVRLVTGSSLPDIGFVNPTSPESIPVALKQNRLAVASSAIEDWIPAWDTGAGTPATPLIGCDKVTMPETFAGVSMTSMTQFTLGQHFAPSAMGLLAPSTDVYATATDVTIASHIWVDVANQSSEFRDWQTAIHQYRFDARGPRYVGSAALDGSVTGQFAFGQVGDRLGIVAAAGTPWLDTARQTTLRLFDTANKVSEVGAIADIGTDSFINGVRFTAKRVVVSTETYQPGGTYPVTLHVLDTSDPTAPKIGGTVTLTGSAGYLHPVDDTHVLAVGSREQTDAEHQKSRTFSPVSVVESIDLSDAATPTVTGKWEAQAAASTVEGDHHAFLWWPSKDAFGFGLYRDPEVKDGPKRAPDGVLVSAASGTLAELGQAVPVDVQATPSCAVTSTEALNIPRSIAISNDTDRKLLLCEAPSDVPRFPGYRCGAVGTSYRYRSSAADTRQEIDESLLARLWYCRPSGPPGVLRMLVVDGGLWMLTTESLEKINPETMASEAVIPVG